MSDNAKVSKRNLSKLEAEDISKEITGTPNIIGYLPNELMDLDDVLIIEIGTEIVGVLAYIETKNFVDLKVLIVKETFRGNGYGTMLFKTFIKIFEKTEKPIYSVTRNPHVTLMFKQSGFIKVSYYKLPLACILHQSKMVFSFYRIKEFIRKSIHFPQQDKFSYYIRN
jgi:N-acetylglutamate synthase-like GNAT family acetyltransferase